MDAAFESVQERRLREAAFQYCEWMRTSGHGPQASLTIRLKDLVGSFNGKSVLTVGDLCHWCFSERQSTYPLHTGFDICKGIKADGFDFYAINCKPYGLPINRPQPFNSPLSRLFFFVSMRSEGLRLDCLSSFQGMCSDEQQELKVSMPSFNLLRGFLLSSDFKIKKHCFKCFYGYALMNKVQLLENSSSGRNYFSP